MSRNTKPSRSAPGVPARRPSRAPHRLAALATGSLTVTGLLVGSPLTVSALAQGAPSYTQTVHGTDQLDPNFSANPCTGDPINGSQDEKGVRERVPRSLE